MKNLFLIVIVVLFLSCKSSKIIDLGGKTVSKGIIVAQEATEIYKLLIEQDSLENYWLDTDKILNHPNPNTMDLPDNHLKGFSEQIIPRIKGYRALIETYRVFSLLTDTQFSDKSKEAITSLRDSYNALEKLPDIPSKVSDLLPELSKTISQSIQAKKIKSHSKILYNLTEAYLRLWKEDENAWEKRLELMYNQQITRLNRLENQIYDSLKVSQSFKTLYKDKYLIILYRLSIRNELIQQKTILKNKIDNFTKVLTELNKVHGELAKTKVNFSEVASTLDRIEKLLK